ncbi:MAG TPA: DUF2934 domain-containing protein [Bryobacteraceae bacterium]|nr:DUF2934 domain-containing protein [Bryobacteraceae bacterium]
MTHSHVAVEREEQPVNETEIAVLAYALWEKRGRPIGSPEEDWFAAERALKLKKLTRTFGNRLSSQMLAAANK